MRRETRSSPCFSAGPYPVECLGRCAAQVPDGGLGFAGLFSLGRGADPGSGAFPAGFSAGRVPSPNDNFTLDWASIPSDSMKKADAPKACTHFLFRDVRVAGTVAVRQIRNR